MGYGAHLEGWRSVKGVEELAKSFLVNRTLREIVVRNLINPNAWLRLSRNAHVFEVDRSAPINIPE